jgi:hypothetical protein
MTEGSRRVVRESRAAQPFAAADAARWLADLYRKRLGKQAYGTIMAAPLSSTVGPLGVVVHCYLGNCNHEEVPFLW